MSITSTTRYDPERLHDRRADAGFADSHAVVAGASVAGVLAARVLADVVDRVTLVEPDDIPGAPVARRGVPHSRNLHVLQTAGRAILEDLFPGYGEDLLDEGGLLVDAAAEATFHQSGGTLADWPTPTPLYCASRPLLEYVARRRLLDRDDVTLRTGAPVVDYVLDDAGDRVTGVELDAGGDRERLAADLVVDATGRTSRTSTWLENNGYRAPPTREVHVGLAYGTLRVERPRDDRRMIVVFPSPPDWRGAAVVPIEDGQWDVTLYGYHGDHPPTDEAGFEAFAASLPCDLVRDLLATHEWASSIGRYPVPTSVRRRYERLDGLPDGLLPIGDAVASFNPIYGQGLSSAALQAVDLHHALAGGRDGLQARYLERVGATVDVPWQLALAWDARHPETAVSRSLGTRLAARYLDRLVRRAHSDPALADAYIRVVTMERPPRSLFRPAIARRVLLSGR